VLNASLREADGMLPTFMMDTNLHGVWQKYQRFDYEFAMFTVFNKLVDPVNLFIQAQEPWNLFKVGKLDQLANVIYSVLERLRQVAVLIAPVTPILSKEIFEQLGYDVTTTQAGDSAVCRELLLNGQPLRWEHLFTPLPFGQALQLRGPILPRLDSELAGAAKKQ
jgi:methionyl-tRNA synthetase